MDSDRSGLHSMYGGNSTEVDQVQAFLRERFRSEGEAASFVGGPQGRQAVLNEDELAKALKMAGYRNATTGAFRQLMDSNSGGVRIADLLRGAGLPRDQSTFGSMGSAAFTLASGPAAGTESGGMHPAHVEVAAAVGDAVSHADRQLRSEVEELRREVSNLRARSEQAVSREDHMVERGNRELGEGAMRQLSAKLEEALARETVALRADNADLRASLTEALRLLSEERKDRSEAQVDHEKRIRELHIWTEEKTARLENNHKNIEAHTTEHKSSLNEVEQLLQVTEYRILQALQEETRAREASTQKEQQTREAATSDLETRWRMMLTEERSLRAKEHDGLNQHIVKCEDTTRTERENQLQRLGEVAGRLEDTHGQVRDEVRQRQAEVLNVHGHLEDAHKKIDTEGRYHRDMHDEHNRNNSNVKETMEQHVDRLDKELAMTKQTILDLRAASQVEATTREEAVARLQNLLVDEARTREEGLSREGNARSTQDKAFEQHLRQMMGEERKLREDDSAQTEQKVSNLQHEHNFEKAKASAQARELAGALTQAREIMQNESAVRKSDSIGLQKAMDEMRDSLEQEKAVRDKAEARLLEQMGHLDQNHRDESQARQASDRKVMGAHGELHDNHERHARTLEELEGNFVKRFEEEQNIREQADIQERKAREQIVGQNAKAIKDLVDKYAADHDAKHKSHEQWQTGMEQARAVDNQELEEKHRGAHARIGELTDEHAETRRKVREAMGATEDITKLKELLVSEKAQRQDHETSLELAVKELQVRLDHVHLSHENTVRKHDQRHTELHEKLEGEANNRTNHINEIKKRSLDDTGCQEARHQEERRHVEGLLQNHHKAIHEKIDEEKSIRDSALSAHVSKAHEQKEAIEEVRRWRVEQYNELCAQVSKVAEMLNEEAKSRQQQDQVLAGEVGRLREEAHEEQNNRKKALDGCQEDMRAVLARLERQRELAVEKEKEHKTVTETIQHSLSTETLKREAVDGELRQILEREVLTREEMLAGVTRSWQKANQRTSEEWRQAVKAEAIAVEQNTIRVDQELQEVRGAIQETRATIEQVDEENRQRFKATADALVVEEKARKSEDMMLHKGIEEFRGHQAAEQADRQSGEQHTADRFLVIEGQLREETVAREDGEQRGKKESQNLVAQLQAERAAREDHHHKHEQRITSMGVQHEENIGRERGAREQKHTDIVEELQKGLAAEQASRGADRKEISALYQQLQKESHQEHEERIKADRDLSMGLARLQSLGKEEEESRIEQNERFSADIGALQESVRSVANQREELLKKCMEGVDQVRSVVHKEATARTQKVEQLDEASKDLNKRIRDEVKEREASVRAVADGIVQEQAAREEALVRERRLAEEEVNKATASSRKAREEEERRLQDQLIQVSAAISQERDVRQEGDRQERQKLLDIKEEMTREMKALEVALSKTTNHVHQKHDEHERRTREVEELATTAAQKMDNHRNDLTTEAQKRDAHLVELHSKHADLGRAVDNATKDKKEGAVELRRYMDEELANINAALAADRRAREAGDLQVSSTLKASVREEVEARATGVGTVTKDVQSLKLLLEQECGARENDRGQNQIETQKVRHEMAEVQKERKADALAVRDALGQVTDQMKSVQHQRKEDLERVDSTLAGLGTKLEITSRTSRDGVLAMEHASQLLQAELLKEKEARASMATKIEAKMAEEKRMIEATLASESNARQDHGKALVDSHGKMVDEASQKHVSYSEKLQTQVHTLTDELQKERNLASERARELARGIAALQNLHTSEEQARQQGCHQLQQAIDSVREELIAEVKDRRSHMTKHTDEVQQIARGVQQHSDKMEALHHKINNEAEEIRDRVARETRARESSLAQVEQRSLSHAQAGTPIKSRGLGDDDSADAKTAGYPSGPTAAGGHVAVELKEHQNKTADDLLRHRRQMEGMTSEQQALAASLGQLSDRVDAIRQGLTGVQAGMADVNMKQKALDQVDVSIKATQDLLKKESAERKTEDERLARGAGDMDKRVERSEQQRLVAEDRVRQELLQTKTTLKKDIRDEAAIVEKLQVLVREENQKREEAIAREAKLRVDGQEGIKEAFNGALREERRVREKEVLRLDGRAPVAGKDGGAAGGEGLAVQMDVRGIRQAMGDTQDRLVQVEQRQKSAEERTVSMLDAIMSGLTTPGE